VSAARTYQHRTIAIFSIWEEKQKATTMAEGITIPHHRKRKRRRQDKSAISARLVLDDHVKGDVGILSEDLFAELFPAAAHC